MNKNTRTQLVTSFENVTFSAGSGGFFGIALLQILASAYAIAQGMPTYALDNGLGASVCLIAGVHYTWMRSSRENLISTRYSDWHLTTPLMLIEFYNLSGAVLNPAMLVVVCSVNFLMLVLGQLAAIRRDANESFLLLFSGGTLTGIILGTLVGLGTYRDPLFQNAWMYGFLATWALYPVAFWMRSNIMYNVLDIVSKGLFGICVALITFHV